MIIAIARSVDSSGSIIMREALTAKTWEFLATRPLDRIFIFANSGFNFRTLFHGLRTSLLARPSNPFIKNIHPSNLSKSTCFLHPPSFAFLSSSSFSLSLFHVSPTRRSSYPVSLSFPRIFAFFRNRRIILHSYRRA